ncbi:UDP-2,4-diacetamido-2,4,6-trideoxy-beta-L-altropyranose hydrolase [Clostridium botulinum]|uniref:UDP-2,4-diacetamido-2,4, 6-trideoxy-beta-L-altropyranose hydrolase n=1 Tax=Clostridium botulinum TaxID=1491 RepID=UPI00217DFB7C|nr:UDP-2,4-diacetamido-2,4,6-trideoxy-beta-L-altropyranose hydrolase [Clostridium botulinum]
MEKFYEGIKRIKSSEFNVLEVEERDLIREIIKLQRKHKADMLITDSYNVNEQYFNITKKYFSRTVYVDDINKHYLNVDLIINQNIGAEDLIYDVPKNSKLLLGIKYLMLREEFRVVSYRNINKRILNIMITIGASDFNGITNIICKYVKELEYEFHIVVGPAFKNENICELMELSEKYKNIKLYFNVDMVKLMSLCDLAISACGSTLYELAVCGVPTIGVIVAENQEQVSMNLQNCGVIINLGWYNKLNKEFYCRCIKYLDKNIKKRIKMNYNAHKLIDGNGVARITEILNNTKDRRR